jgi:hypothetical protein
MRDNMIWLRRTTIIMHRGVRCGDKFSARSGEREGDTEEE